VNSPLKSFLKYLIFLFLFTITIAAVGFLIVYSFNSYMTLKNLIYLLLTFAAISFTTLFIFFRGQTKEPVVQFVYTFSAISLKFILSAVAALVWFVVVKKVQTQYVLLFFILYLSFTFFSVMVILKVLNNKAL
jgi:hypothetical protein